jgi:hypothetical protein
LFSMNVLPRRPFPITPCVTFLNSSLMLCSHGFHLARNKYGATN